MGTPGVPTPLGCGEILGLLNPILGLVKHGLPTSGTPSTGRTLERCSKLPEWFGLGRTLELVQFHGQGPLRYPRFSQAPSNTFPSPSDRFKPRRTNKPPRVPLRGPTWGSLPPG